MAKNVFTKVFISINAVLLEKDLIVCVVLFTRQSCTISDAIYRNLSYANLTNKSIFLFCLFQSSHFLLVNFFGLATNQISFSILLGNINSKYVVKLTSSLFSLNNCVFHFERAACKVFTFDKYF